LAVAVASTWAIILWFVARAFMRSRDAELVIVTVARQFWFFAPLSHSIFGASGGTSTAGLHFDSVPKGKEPTSATTSYCSPIIQAFSAIP